MLKLHFEPSLAFKKKVSAMPLLILKCRVTTLKQVKVASTAKKNNIEFKFNDQMESQK